MRIQALILGIVLIAGCSPASDFEEPQSMTVQVFFDHSDMNPNALDCGAVFPVERTVLASDDVLAATIVQVLAGPTVDEAGTGYQSPFSAATQDALLSVAMIEGTAYVNLADFRSTVTSGSSSCGSAQLIAELTKTAMQFPEVYDVEFAFDGDPAAFYEWVQIGCSDEHPCDSAPFLQTVGQ